VVYESKYDSTGWHGQPNPLHFGVPPVSANEIAKCAPVSVPEVKPQPVMSIDIVCQCATPGKNTDDVVGGGLVVVDSKPVVSGNVTIHTQWGDIFAITDASGHYGFKIEKGRYLDQPVVAEYNGSTASFKITSELFNLCQNVPEKAPNGAVSDGHPEYAGAYLGTIQIDQNEELPLYQTVFDKNHAAINPGKGFAKSESGNITGHYNQGGTMVGEWLKNATTVTIRYTTGETVTYHFGGSFEPHYGDAIPTHAGLAISTSNWINGWTGTDLFRLLV
jgi:hypothetical protein